MIDFLNDYQGPRPVKQFVETTIFKCEEALTTVWLSKNLTVLLQARLEPTENVIKKSWEIWSADSSVMGQKEKDIEDTKGYSFTM